VVEEIPVEERDQRGEDITYVGGLGESPKRNVWPFVVLGLIPVVLAATAVALWNPIRSLGRTAGETIAPYSLTLESGGWSSDQKIATVPITLSLTVSNADQRTIDKALQLSPKSVEVWGLKIEFAIEQRGDFSEFDRAIAQFKSGAQSSPGALTAPSAADLAKENAFNLTYVQVSRLGVLMLQRKFQEAIAIAEKIDENIVAGKPELVCKKYGFVGLARRYAGDEAGARRELLKAKEVAQKILAQAPDNAGRHMQLAQIMALLGEKDEAVAEALRAQQLQPESVDAFEGPQITQQLAEVYAINGDATRAIDLLDGLFQRPSPITTHLLKLQLQWDPIRKDPRFQALIDKYGAKA